MSKETANDTAQPASERSCPDPAGSVFIVFSRNGNPKSVGRNAKEAWKCLSGETMRWEFWRNLYRTQYGYYGRTIYLPNAEGEHE